MRKVAKAIAAVTGCWTKIIVVNFAIHEDIPSKESSSCFFTVFGYCLD
jgi:hypothetical protein